MKLKLKEVRQVVRETVKERNLVEAKQTADRILAEKESFLGGLARKAGFSNPSRDVDDPKHVQKTLDKSIDTASKTAEEFQASSLRTTKEINKFHDSIKNVLDQVSSLSDTPGPEKAKEYHGKMIELARNFYSLLKRESDRIDSYLKTVSSDLQGKGIDKRQAYQNTSGLKGKKNDAEKTSDEEPEDDEDFKKRLGIKNKSYRDDSTALFNDKDPKQVKDFLRGKSKVRA